MIIGVVKMNIRTIDDGSLRGANDWIDAEQRYAEDAGFRNLVLALVAACAESGISAHGLRQAVELALYRLQKK